MKLQEIRRPGIDYKDTKSEVIANIADSEDARKMRILTNKWQRFETSMRNLKTHLENTKTEIKTYIKDIVDAADQLKTIKMESEKFIVTMDKQVEKTKESKDKFYVYLAKALNMSIEAVQALEESLTERIKTGEMKEPALRYTANMESVMSKIKDTFYSIFVKKYIDPIKEILGMIGAAGHEEDMYNGLSMEDIYKYGTKEDVEFLKEEKIEEKVVVTPEELKDMTLNELAIVVYDDWKDVNYAAQPYLDAMTSLEYIADNYGADSGYSVVAYFLSNASQWKGDIARAVKGELKRRLKRG